MGAELDADLFAAIGDRAHGGQQPVSPVPRGAGTGLARYVADVPVDAVGIDWMIERDYVRDHIQPRRPIQGNVDPLALLAGGAALDNAIDATLKSFAAGPFIFNLGHGVLPDTPVEHVDHLVARVRGTK